MEQIIKFNKKTVMGLKEGDIVISNSIRSDGFPIVCEYVSAPEERLAQWERIRKTSRNNGGFVFQDNERFWKTLESCLATNSQYNTRRNAHHLEHKIRMQAYEKGIAPYPMNPIFNQLIPFGIVNIVVHPENQTADIMYSCLDRATGEIRIVQTHNTGIPQGDGSFDFTSIAFYRR